MKRKIKLILLCFMLFATYTYGQKKQVFFIADTLSSNINNRFIEIGKEGQMGYYVLYCKCIIPYDNYVTFKYKINKSTVQIVNRKPESKYSSVKELLDLLTKSQNNFDNQYELFITEKLPNDKYKTNQVELVRVGRLDPDYIILK
ncbi:hypothetical protein HDF26_004559 [Pedobacter cryoconitis]|uniref:hypothetical protein n=1 Tax=Pedobacter cryoconitis TaxID=188932 RepID=UPI00161DBB50|nr:hypothetical protein [Pedobacter cryoconitis]MBB6274086.1 hypothetical protein [Pedobacter cryoconitis]